VVWGGADDFFAPSPADANPQATANRAVANLVAMVSTLQSLGAAQIIVPGMPDLGLTPRIQGQGQAAAAQASAVTAYFNAALQSQLPAGATYFDTASLLHQIIANPAAFGFTNVSDACLSTIPCLNPDQYVFWDGIHPTAHTHQIVAERLAAVAVPEPASWGLALAGLALVGAKRLRRRSGEQS
jgi:MYXO-CTERM domain-containing protein